MRIHLAGLLVLVTLAMPAMAAQESADDDRAAEIDDLEPGVSSTDLAAMEVNEPEVTGNGQSPKPVALVAQGVTRREGTAGVMDEIDLGRSEITGNQELPKVLYIVPWQKSGPAELMGKPVNTLLEEVLAPIDRTEFVRQVDYYGDLYGEEEEQN